MTTAQEIYQDMKESNIEFIVLQFTDILGNFQHYELPISQWQKIIKNEIMFDGSSIGGFASIENSDLYLAPDFSTYAKIPWEDNVARIICSVLNADGTPFAFDSRTLLARSVEQLKKFHPEANLYVGPEPEFFLLKADGTPSDLDGYFSTHEIGGVDRLRREISRTLQSLDFTMEALHHEVAHGQQEINFRYEHALKAADSIQTFKWVVKTIAAKHGYKATFMPKPFFGQNGSGMHLNQSLCTAETNLFYDENSPDGLSEMAHAYIAGVLAHVRDIAAVTNPTVNSYKRLVPGYEAPCYLAWSCSNRSALIRIPAGRGFATRVEVRNPDPLANPYLAIALLLAAGLDGIKRDIPLVAPVDRDIFHMDESVREELRIQSLPGDLHQALALFTKSELAKQTLGEEFVDRYVKLKHMEYDEYRTCVHTWEWEKYC